MTFTIGTDCADLTVNSQFITDFDLGEYDTLKISVDINCCGSPVELDLQVTDVEDGDYVITPAFFGLEDALEDGVYKITLLLTDSEDTEFEEVGCVLIDCETSCAIAEHRATSPTTDTPFLIELIRNTQDCDCVCDSLCVIYKEIQAELNGENNNC